VVVAAVAVAVGLATHRHQPRQKVLLRQVSHRRYKHQYSQPRLHPNSRGIRDRDGEIDGKEAIMEGRLQQEMLVLEGSEDNQRRKGVNSRMGLRMERTGLATL
jgi:hypothetical protein